MTPLLVSLATLAFLLPSCLLPLSLRQPYRAGSARRPDGAWGATLLVVCFGLAIALLTVVALALGRSAPGILPMAWLAMGVGGLLGALGLSVSAWENRSGQMYFVPDPWVGLALWTIVIARLGFGASRAWHAWLAWTGDPLWLGAAALPGTFAAAMLLAGFGAAFWGGVRLRIARRASATRMYAEVGASGAPPFKTPRVTALAE